MAQTGSSSRTVLHLWQPPVWNNIYYSFLQTLRLHTRVISKINDEKFFVGISQQFMRWWFLKNLKNLN
jgi:hypothetical protein